MHVIGDMMNKYVISIERTNLKKEVITIDDLFERVQNVEGITAPEKPMKRLVVEYTGTRKELYDALGYTSSQVHIEDYVQDHHIK